MITLWTLKFLKRYAAIIVRVLIFKYLFNLFLGRIFFCVAKTAKEVFHLWLASSSDDGLPLRTAVRIMWIALGKGEKSDVQDGKGDTRMWWWPVEVIGIWVEVVVVMRAKTTEVMVMRVEVGRIWWGFELWWWHLWRYRFQLMTMQVKLNISRVSVRQTRKGRVWQEH